MKTKKIVWSSEPYDDSKPQARTPTPWKIEAYLDNNGSYAWTAFRRRGDIVGANTPFEGEYLEEAKANAAFIVRVVNAHDGLIAVLKEALNQALCDGDLCAYDWHDKAREAIAKAEGL